MIAKNMLKQQNKKYRIVVDGRFCTIEHKSAKHPERQVYKKSFLKEIKMSEY